MANRRLRAGVVVAVALIAGAAGFYFRHGSLTSPTVERAVQKLTLASFSDLSGRAQPMSQWRGKVLVVNFWATWCAPCREEIPALMRVQDKHTSNGVQFVGIAMDNVTKVRDYAAKMHINYVLLIGGIESLGISKDLGNGAGVLPFTVVLDRDGKMAYVHAGALTEVILEAVLTPLL